MCVSLEASALRPIKHMIELGMHMEGVVSAWTSGRQARHIKEQWKYNWKHTQNVLHKIIYFSFRMTFQTYLWDSSLWVQVQYQSYDNIRAGQDQRVVQTRSWNCVQEKMGWRTLLGSCGDITSKTVRETRRLQLENQFLQSDETWLHTAPASSFCSPVHWLTSHSGAHACNVDWNSGCNVCMRMCVLSKAVVLEEWEENYFLGIH